MLVDLPSSSSYLKCITIDRFTLWKCSHVTLIFYFVCSEEHHTNLQHDLLAEVSSSMSYHYYLVPWLRP
ncbi:hypothetical protein M758_UG091900 [Ceratodon purpureus]|nr:hypothetical protein M758_UG091900 [Ceratodon purpureus]